MTTSLLSIIKYGKIRKITEKDSSTPINKSFLRCAVVSTHYFSTKVEKERKQERRNKVEKRAKNESRKKEIK